MSHRKHVNFILGGDAESLGIDLDNMALSASSPGFTTSTPVPDADPQASGNGGGIEVVVPSVTQSPDIRPHSLLVELYDLCGNNTVLSDGTKDWRWQETARWIKYEEDVQGVDKHFGRPHVAFLSFHSLLLLRRCIAKGIVMLDVQQQTYPGICAAIAQTMVDELKLEASEREMILSILLSRHKHGHENRLGLARALTHAHFSHSNASQAGVSKSPWSPESAPETVTKSLTESVLQLNTAQTGGSLTPQLDRAVESSKRSWRHQESFMRSLFPDWGSPTRKTKSPDKTSPGSTSRSLGGSLDGLRDHGGSILKKVPLGSESAQVFVGTVEEMTKVHFAFIRLADAVMMPELLKAPIPVRFIFVVLGPTIPDVDFHEIGRSISTLMSNEHFHEVAYEAECRLSLLKALDLFLDESIVIPSGQIDRSSLLTVHDIQKALKQRRAKKLQGEAALMGAQFLSRQTSKDESGNGSALLPRSRRKRSTSMSSTRSFITDDPLKRVGKPFGGMIKDVKRRFPAYLSDFKDAYSFQCVTSLFFMFFACFAPAIAFGGLLGEKTDNLMGASETLMAQCICGIVWALLGAQPLIIMAATGPVLIFEGSLFQFCAMHDIEFLVFRMWAAIWMVVICILTVAFEASFLVRLVTRFTEDVFASLISLIFVFESFKFMLKNFITLHPLNTLYGYCLASHTCNNSNLTMLSNWSSSGNDGLLYKQPDTALLSAVLLLATFTLSYFLKQLRNSCYLGRSLRRAIGDFGVPIAICVVVLLDQYAFPHAYLQRLHMPDHFGLTAPEKRPWFVNPRGIEKAFPIWAMFAAIIPAFLAFILLFVETGITQLLLIKPERGLLKGVGFHWDMLLVGLMTLLCGAIGLPWMCAAAVQSLAHASSLTVMKRHAPGERQRIDHVIEQRVTSLGVAVLTGACTFMGALLQRIPLAVLFGVFLYLGVMNMSGIQFLHRIALFIIPEKYFPDELPFVQQVHMLRMHLFTIIQMACLAAVWLFKSFEQTALAFPFALTLIAVLRKLALPCIFKAQELDALDAEGEVEEEKLDEEADFYEEARGLGF